MRHTSHSAVISLAASVEYVESSSQTEPAGLVEHRAGACVPAQRPAPAVEGAPGRAVAVGGRVLVLVDAPGRWRGVSPSLVRQVAGQVVGQVVQDAWRDSGRWLAGGSRQGAGGPHPDVGGVRQLAVRQRAAPAGGRLERVAG